MSIPSGKCYERCLWTAALGHFAMLYKTGVARDSILPPMAYAPKGILTCGSYCRCLGEIPMFYSLSLPDWSILSVNSVNMDETWMSNTNFLSKLTIVIPQLPTLLRMANAVSSTVKLFNSVTADSVYLFNIAMWAFASKCFPIEEVPWSDGWRRTWWKTIYMMPGLPVYSIQHCK